MPDSVPEAPTPVMEYTVVIEGGPTSYGAHVLELPGCVAAATTRKEVASLIREAVQLYTEELERDGLPVPKTARRG